VFGFALVEAQFESIMAFKDVSKHVDLETLFEILDYNHDGRIDGLEFLGGLALCCQASFEDKARFCFEMYDFNLNASMSKKEMTIMIMASINGMALLTGDQKLIPSLSVLDKIVENAFQRADKNKTGSIGFDDFMGWARSNRDIMTSIESLSKISANAKTVFNDDDSAEEVVEGELSDAEDGVEHGAAASAAFDSASSSADSFAINSVASSPFVQWRGLLEQLEPTNFRYSKKLQEGPDTNVELAWAHGFLSVGARNNVHYTNDEGTSVVWPAASLGVVYSLASKEQRFYQGHADKITCLALHPKYTYVATGDCKGNVHLWSPKTQEVSFIIRCLSAGKSGVLHLRFSPQGDKIAAVGADPDHTVTIYSISGQVLSSGRGIASPNNVFALDFSLRGDELCLVGRQQILFCRGIDTGKRSLDSVVGRVGKIGKKQTFFSVAYTAEQTCVVGCASGEIYKFVSGAVTQVVQAHGIQDPVLSISFCAAEGLLITGGRDSLVRSWDTSLKEVGIPLDLSEEELGGEAITASTAVISVELCKGRLLIATKGCEVFEARLPATVNDGYSMTKLNTGHFRGALCGLAAHPSREEFATCGDDKTLRIWSIRSHEQLNCRKLLCEARALSYGPGSGDFLCVGMEDGTVALIEVKSPSLRVYATWKHSSKPITNVKFSPDGLRLAAASEDKNIYLYKSEDKKHFRRQAVCRGHTGPVLHMDFSATSQLLQSNGQDHALLYWDVYGNQIKNVSTMRDVVWATFTCPLAWQTKGVWIDGASSSSPAPYQVNTCYCVPEVEDLITGDNLGRINVFRYPAVSHGEAMYLSFVGHAAPVARVRVSANKRFIISVGGDDRTILLWRHEVEATDDTDDEAGGGSDSSTGSAVAQKNAEVLDLLNDFSDIRRRSRLEVAVSNNASREELAKLPLPLGYRNSSDRWRSAVIEPSAYKPHDLNDNDVDLTLRWIHGYRSRDCRNSLRYSASGRIVYTAASVGVVYSKTSGKQSFLLGAHSDEIMGIAIHPNGQIFATGDAGSEATIVVWNSSDTRVYQRLERCHSRGVPLLSFNTKGNLLASVGLDNSHTLAVHDWQNGIEIMRTPTQRNIITCLVFLTSCAGPGESALGSDESSSSSSSSYAAPPAPSVIVTGGLRHLTYWWTQGSNCKSQRALWGKARSMSKLLISCLASGTPDVCVSGNVKGDLVVWHKFRAVSDTAGKMGDAWGSNIEGSSGWARWGLDGDWAKYPHKDNTIQSIWAIPGEVLAVDGQSWDLPTPANTPHPPLSQAARYVSADDKGRIVVWRLCVSIGDPASFHLRPVKVLVFTENETKAAALGLTPTPMSRCIRSVCERDGVLLIGTQAGEIYEVIDSSIDFLQQPLGAPLLSSSSSASSASAAPQRASVPACPPLRSQRLLASHHRGQTWGLAAHPYLPVAFSAGDDHTLRCWSLGDDKLLSYLLLPQKVRSIDVSAGGDLVAALMSDGGVWSIKTSVLLKPKDSTVTGPLDLRQRGDRVSNDELVEARTVLPSTATHCGQKVKFCFDVPLPSWKGRQLLAASCHDKSLAIFSGVDGVFSPPAQLLPFADSFVTHIDFGVFVSHQVPDAAATKDAGAGAAAPLMTTSKRWLQYYDHERGVLDWVAKAPPPPPPSSSSSFSSSSSSSSALSTIQEEGTPREQQVEEKPLLRDVALSDVVLQAASADGQLAFWRFDGAVSWRPISPLEAKDVWWASWTSPYGWPVQGIRPSAADGSEILAVARPKAWEQVCMLASADSYGALRLFAFPSISTGTPDKCYRGHCGPVANLVFSGDDSTLITTGSHDRCLFVWDTDILDEMRERRALKTGSFGEDSRVPAHLAADGSPSSSIAAAASQTGEALSLVPIKARTPPASVPSRPVPMPWRSTVREPTGWADPPSAGAPPAASLELKFAYGYRGWDCRNNIGFAGATGQIVYHIGGVGVSYSADKHQQVHNTDHAPSDIISLAVHPDGHTVATGEIAPLPRIVVWDANTGVSIRTLLFHRRGVNNLCFSREGDLLISTGMDEEHTIVVHNLFTGAVVGTGKAGSITLLTVSVSSDSKFLTGGEGHIKFWDIPPSSTAGGMLSVKSGIYNNKGVSCKTVLSSAYLGVDGVTGMLDGTVLLWKERSSTKFVKAHEGAVTSLFGVPGEGAEQRVLSGGRDGMVHLWSYKLTKIWSMSMIETTPPSCNPAIQALAFLDSTILIGTLGSEIYTVDMDSNDVFCLVQGHHDERAEVWGLAAQPGSLKFATAGDDGTIRLWDAKTKRAVCLSKAEEGSKVRSIVYKPDGSVLVAGTLEGKIIVLSADLTEEIAVVTVCSAGVRALSFSPDGATLAVGTSDGRVFLLDSKHYSCRAECRSSSPWELAGDQTKSSPALQDVKCYS
jgi:microtubule-associated protein-like 6